MLEIVQPGNCLHDTCKGRMLGDIGDLFAMHPHFAAIAEAFDVTPAILDPGGCNACVFVQRRRLAVGCHVSASRIGAAHATPS